MAARYRRAMLSLALLLAVAPSLIAQPGTVDIKSTLDVRDVLYDQVTHQLSWAVVNTSGRTIIAYELLIKLPRTNGRTMVTPYPDVRIGTLNLTDIPAHMADSGYGPFRSLQVVHRQMTFIAPDLVGTVDIAPAMAVFDDNSVAGDESEANHRVFEPQRVIAADLQDYLDSLSKVDPATDVRQLMVATRDGHAASAYQEGRTGNFFEPSPHSAANIGIRGEADNAIRSIDHHTKSPQQALADHIERIRRRLKEVQQHCYPYGQGGRER